MKKTVVVDLEYMRPTPVGGGRRSCSHSRSRSRSRSGKPVTTNEEELNISTLLQIHKDEYDEDDSNTDISGDAIDDDNTGSSSSNSDRSDGSYSSEGSDAPASRIHPSVKDTDYAVDSDEDLLQSVLDEPTFPLDINAILSAMNKAENNTIANMTFKKITDRRHEILSSLNLTTEKMEEFERKLHMYRVIENPYDLKHNQLIRWIPLRSLETRPYVTIGGTLFRVRENQVEKLHIVTIRNIKKFVYNIRFELNVMFQRLSQEELLILRAVDYVDGC